jgi:hypothetical protein
MPHKPSTYHAYLLRLWCDGATNPWRASLESPDGVESRTFASLPALFAFLEQQTREIQAACAEAAADECHDQV